MGKCEMCHKSVTGLLSAVVITSLNKGYIEVCNKCLNDNKIINNQKEYLESIWSKHEEA